MNTFEFIAALIKSLAWPLVVLGCSVMFRRPLAALIGSIRKISHKDTAVEFDRAAQEVKANIAASTQPASAKLIAPKAKITTNVGQIVSEWVQLEDIVRRRLERAGIDASSLDSSSVLRLADAHKLITHEQFGSLFGLNTMRNLAVHGRQGDIDEERTQEFRALAEAMRAVLDNPNRPT